MGSMPRGCIPRVQYTKTLRMARLPLLGHRHPEAEHGALSGERRLPLDGGFGHVKSSSRAKGPERPERSPRNLPQTMEAAERTLSEDWIPFAEANWGELPAVSLRECAPKTFSGHQVDPLLKKEVITMEDSSVFPNTRETAGIWSRGWFP